ncbi:putative photosynthetic complex assembly protein PuhE [Lichenifustis flavocetrariae]|uniref:Photosynthetic complex assembly protein PuhE n=1 Tax=Lichenifustis flavocetrariae TaxID=2949735 RepID=A0AA41YYP3_9HYPH|nr:putative photosynthetic complex assembly protein PuhE [Lichenifustis flavocetrariae]MCW6507313.1 putative photosynthetic complex assembly protein PuhE [Lichenifustis flavocetrariae]
MIFYGLPVAFTLFLWWSSTGAIFFLDSRPTHTFRWSMAGATAIMAGAVYALTQTSRDVSIGGAYIGFAIGLALWGWLEIGYYMGFMMGPRREPSPDGCSGWRHFFNAAATTLYHELAALALAAMIAAVTWDMPNKVAFWTFAILWLMQLSAKLNVFLGVPNLAEEFLPAHLSFLRSFMTRKSMNLFFPVSITVSMISATLMIEGIVSGEATPFQAVSLTMLSSLMVLAILEHWFLVVPLPVEALWRWCLQASRQVSVDATAVGVEGASESSPSHKRIGQSFAEPGLSQPVTP